MKVNKQELIILPSRISLFTDKKTGVKTFSIPITFPDNTNGVLTVTKFTRDMWLPTKDIKSITITHP